MERGESATRSYDGTDVLFEVILPPPHLFVIGTGHDAVPVVRLAKSLGWNVTVCARQIRVSIRERFAGCEVLFGSPKDLAARIDTHERAFAVVMGHDFDADREHVAMLLASRTRYIGILGPRARTARMLADLGVDAGDPRVHAPVGLELGAETPEEIALAIVAEIQSVLGKATATHLRDRRGSIHERPTLAPS
jgi:xanthine/CO dehydrogenase XdhC/CoxF family maturation factor